MSIKWKKVKDNKDLIKYQGLGTGRFNEVIITKTTAGHSVLRANPNNAVLNHFKTKKQATDFAKRWMGIQRNKLKRVI
jgi:hypothetical protein